MLVRLRFQYFLEHLSLLLALPVEVAVMFSFLCVNMHSQYLDLTFEKPIKNHGCALHFFFFFTSAGQVCRTKAVI